VAPLALVGAPVLDDTGARDRGPLVVDRLLVEGHDAALRRPGVDAVQARPDDTVTGDLGVVVAGGVVGELRDAVLRRPGVDLVVAATRDTPDDAVAGDLGSRLDLGTSSCRRQTSLGQEHASVSEQCRGIGGHAGLAQQARQPGAVNGFCSNLRLQSAQVTCGAFDRAPPATQCERERVDSIGTDSRVKVGSAREGGRRHRDAT
jgi:hypothetical protein